MIFIFILCYNDKYKEFQLVTEIFYENLILFDMI